MCCVRLNEMCWQTPIIMPTHNTECVFWFFDLFCVLVSKHWDPFFSLLAFNTNRCARRNHNSPTQCTAESSQSLKLKDQNKVRMQMLARYSVYIGSSALRANPNSVWSCGSEAAHIHRVPCPVHQHRGDAYKEDDDTLCMMLLWFHAGWELVRPAVLFMRPVYWRKHEFWC